MSRSSTSGARVGSRDSLWPRSSSRTRSILVASCASSRARRATSSTISPAMSCPRGSRRPGLHGALVGARATVCAPLRRRARALRLRLDARRDRPRKLLPRPHRRERFRVPVPPSLRSRLEAPARGTDPESIPGLHARASLWLEEHGDIEHAIDHAIASRDLARASHLIMRVAVPLLSAGRMHTVNRWFDSLSWPEAVGDRELATMRALAARLSGKGATRSSDGSGSQRTGRTTARLPMGLRRSGPRSQWSARPTSAVASPTPSRRQSSCSRTSLPAASGDTRASCRWGRRSSLRVATKRRVDRSRRPERSPARAVERQPSLPWHTSRSSSSAPETSRARYASHGSTRAGGRDRPRRERRLGQRTSRTRIRVDAWRRPSCGARAPGTCGRARRLG